ncbi:FtsK/SpoIIIE domain-containing protein [Phytoactinopolyspora halotolerans]|uniref:Cell division protein FtsK n=1 Tax=Phytoactinopolyspora halotolerans TaxID=1981512 RepID=A0A6L9SAE3_9ACTN|nr:FtsK/SpoIIIE domain-containing protein [Phytoactinopolyspora halotolerans]NEE02069.1 cell division protein FtsK [Phytoactinopolyspora halotolerans]
MRVKWAADQVAGDEYDVPRRPGDDDSLVVSLGKGLGLLLLLVPWYGLRHPGTTVVLVATVWLWASHGLAALLAAYAALTIALAAWSFWHRSSFTRFVANPFRSRVRGAWVYRRRWRSAMHLCELSKGWGAERYAPHVIRVRCDAFADRVRVKLLPGQCPSDLDGKTEALASTFGALGCRVQVDKPGVVWLVFTRRDPLVDVVPALEPAASVDLTGVAVGTRDDGQPWSVGLQSTHVLVAGETGAGKGSVVWSVLRGVAPAIRDGYVQAWVADPKGGMELAPGRALFSRFTHEPEPMVALVEQAAELVTERANRLRGIARQHTPTPVEPFVLLVVDELAYLTAYLPERDLSKRLASALSVVLSQGRAVGVSVLAAVQDPRKDIVAMRDLFPVRIALRLTEASQVGMVLGDGARDRGARCDQIPASMPGTGYVLIDGQREPVRVRAAYVSDDDIAATCRTYPAPATGLGASMVEGEVLP